MAKKKVYRKSNKALKLYTDLGDRNKNIYANGTIQKWNAGSAEAWSNATSGSNLGGTIGSVASGVGGIVSAFTSNSKIDSSEVQAEQEAKQLEIDNQKNYQVQATDFDSLLDEWGTRTTVEGPENVSEEDIDRARGWEAAGNVFKGIASGAGAGATVGGVWGAIGGAVAGLGAGIAGIFTGKKKAEREAERLNAEAERQRKEAEEANQRNLMSFNNRANTIDAQQDAAALSSYYADGGKIHIKPENRGKFTALKKRTGKSATWFKEHGTPAQRKMATFALNSRHWSHSYGGSLNKYIEGQEYDLDEDTIMDLINKGYEIEYI